MGGRSGITMIDPIECCEVAWYKEKELKEILENEKQYLKEVRATKSRYDYYRAVIEDEEEEETRQEGSCQEAQEDVGLCGPAKGEEVKILAKKMIRFTNKKQNQNKSGKWFYRRIRRN